MNYLVQWEIDSDANTPLEAAREAFLQMQDPKTTATFFTVINKDTGEKTDIDLMYLNGASILIQ
jgi:hypothetical protein